MAGEKLLYLRRADVEACGLGVGDLIAALEKAFVIKGQGGVELPPKPGIHPRQDAFIHAMPAYVAGLEAAGIKWVSGYPENFKKGLPYICGLVIMNDPDTGFPTSIMDGTWMTAWRTGAVSAVSAKILARPGAEVVGVCGLGVQGRTNLTALATALPGLKEARVYDISPQAQQAYAAEMTQRLPRLKIVPVKSPAAAVQGVDIVVTAGPLAKTPVNPVIELDWLKPGCLALPVDFDSYFAASAFLGCDKFYSDDVGQIRYYQSQGYFQNLPLAVSDLGDLAAGKVKGRERDEERIIACNLGLALDDVVTGQMLIGLAKKKNLGTWLEL